MNGFGIKELDDKELNEPLTIGGNRLAKLLNDPLFYQDLDYIERCRFSARNKGIDLTLLRPSWSFLVIGMKRFYQLFKSGRISIRLKSGQSYNRKKPIVLIVFTQDLSRFDSQPAFTDSFDIKDDDCMDQPNIVQELLSDKSVEELECDKRYVFLYRDGIVRECWEFIKIVTPIEYEPQIECSNLKSESKVSILKSLLVSVSSLVDSNLPELIPINPNEDLPNNPLLQQHRVSVIQYNNVCPNKSTIEQKSFTKLKSSAEQTENKTNKLLKELLNKSKFPAEPEREQPLKRKRRIIESSPLLNQMLSDIKPSPSFPVFKQPVATLDKDNNFIALDITRPKQVIIES